MTRPPGARPSSVASVSASQARSVTAKTSPSRLDAVSSGPNRRKLDRFRSITSRRKPPSTRVASLNVVAGRRHVDRVRRGSRAVPGPGGARRRSRAGSRSYAARRGRQLAKLRAADARMRRTAPPAGSCAATVRGSRGGPRSRAQPRPGPGASARSLRPGRRRPRAGRSSPSASAGRSSASEGARLRGRARAACWIAWISSSASSSAAAKRWCASACSVVETDAHEQRAPAVALEQRPQLVLGDAGEYRRVRDLVAVQMEDRQNGSVGARVEELVRVPARRERAGLRLAVADDARDQRGRGCRTQRRTRVRAHSRARRPRGSSRASRARRATGCRLGTRTGGRARVDRRRPRSMCG